MPPQRAWNKNKGGRIIQCLRNNKQELIFQKVEKIFSSHTELKKMMELWEKGESNDS